MEDALLNINLIAEPAYRTRKFRPKVLQPLPDEIVARIPYEIIEHILDQIRDRKTLSACTRVCYGWHHSSRRRLFAHSAVRLNTFDKISEFVDEIHSSSAKSSIAPYIQSISISMCFDFLLYDEPFSFSYADGAVYVASALRHLASLTSLRSLKLTLQNYHGLRESPQYGKYGNNLHSRIVNERFRLVHEFGRNLGHLINLDLTLLTVNHGPHYFLTCQGFVTFVSSFPKLQRLAINSCYIATMTASEQAFEDCPPLPQLRFLEIGDAKYHGTSRSLITNALLLQWLIRAKRLTGLSIYHDDLKSMNHDNLSFAFKAGGDRLKQIKIFPVRIADCNFSCNSRLEEVEFGSIDLRDKTPGSVNVFSHIMQQISSHSIKTLIFTFEITVIDDLDAVDWVELCRALKDEKFASLSTGLLEFRLNRLTKNAGPFIKEKLSSLSFPFRVCPDGVCRQKRRREKRHFEPFPLE